MSTEVKNETQQGQAAPPQDEIKNLKAEMNRKLDNTTAQLQALLDQMKKPTAPTETKKAPSVFEDEEAFAASIEQRAAERIRKEQEATQAAQARYQNTVQGILREYPEAADEASDLMKRAKEIYGALGDDERNSPLAMKAAVAEAASEIGLKPKSKRPQNDDDSFALSGSTQSTRRSSREPDLDPATVAFAKALGQPVDDPKYLERLKAAAKRKNWKKYE